MAKKIVKVEDTKKSKKSLDLGKISTLISENGDAIEKIADGITDLIDSNNSKKKKTTKKSVKKTTKKSSSNKDSLSTVIDIAGTILKNK